MAKHFRNLSKLYLPYSSIAIRFFVNWKNHVSSNTHTLMQNCSTCTSFLVFIPQPPFFQLRQPRGKSLESLEDPNERIAGATSGGPMIAGHLSFVRPSSGAVVVTAAAADLYYSSGGGGGCHQSALIGGFGQQQYTHGYQSGMQQPWRRSYDDGDITPTNECGNNCCDLSSQQGGGTLPRHHRGGVPRQRPIAKVMANLPFQGQMLVAADVDYVNENVLMCSAGKVSE